MVTCALGKSFCTAIASTWALYQTASDTASLASQLTWRPDNRYAQAQRRGKLNCVLRVPRRQQERQLLEQKQASKAAGATRRVSDAQQRLRLVTCGQLDGSEVNRRRRRRCLSRLSRADATRRSQRPP
jgi:hypothetical protein